MSMTAGACRNVDRLSYDAIIGRDYRVVLGSLFAVTAASLVARLAGDVAYALIDPCIHPGEGETPGVLGDSGCGKSALASMNARLT
jgi:ABC-type uncharacterized transport system YnjBCD ATPase subunit